MKIHEYQAKEILKSFGINVPGGRVISTMEEAESAARNYTGGTVAVKAQIHAGGRGKAGGVKIARSAGEMLRHVDALLNKKLVTKQTGPEGQLVRRVLLEEGCEIQSEYYIAFVLDREISRIAFIASGEGGMEIENITSEKPMSIFRETIDPLIGFADFQARRAAFHINIPKQHIHEFVSITQKIYACFIRKDCLLAEINPLVLTKDGKMVALDAKLNFDDNGLYRHDDVLSYRDIDEEDAKELEASKYGLSYVSLGGTIGCMVNGAGLAMATMDIIKHYGGDPANFLDVGGSATAEKVTAAFKIILSDDHVKGIFVNIFGGIMKCDVIAEGIIAAAKETGVHIPAVIRLEGTNAAQGKKLLSESGLRFFTVDSMGRGAQKIVELAKEAAS